MRIQLPILLSVLVLIAGCQSSGPRTSTASQGHPVADINVRLGAAYMQDGKYELALNKLNRALAIDPNYPSVHNMLGLLYDRMGETDYAEKHLRRAISLNPHDSEAQNNYGTFLCKHGRPEEAEPHFLKALDNPLYRTPDIAYSNAGSCVFRTGDVEKAETYFRQALKANPKQPLALFKMAEVSHKTGNHLSARAYLQRYLEVAQHNAETLWLGIRLERELGDRNAVSSYALRLKSNFPDSPQARALLESESARK